MTDKTPTDNTRGWDTYWQGAMGSDAFAQDGFSHPGLTSIWPKAIGEFVLANSDKDVKFLDIGSGSGAVVESMYNNAAIGADSISCVDISAAAIEGVQSRFPGINGVVADARKIPLEDGSFDLITSQFGIEYAGQEAFGEAARLLAPDGDLLFILHIKDGSLFRECGAAVDALRRAEKSQFLTLTHTFFEAGFAAVRGADRAPYEIAAGEMNPAIRELEAILNEHGEHVAGGTIVSLLMEVQNIHSRIEHYDPDEVLTWLAKMQSELPKQLKRMESMRDAALDEKSFRAVCEKLAELGLKVTRAQPAQVEGEDQPIAWILQAKRES